MPVHFQDFGKDIIEVQDDDSFFLDTNVVIAYLNENDHYHRVCVFFINFLLSKNVTLFLSEIVLAEAINGLARNFYTEHRLRTVGGDPFHHRSRWGRYVIKQDSATLARFNELACKAIAPLLNSCVIAPSDEKHFQNGMLFSYEYPLASADALIVSSACFSEVTGIISLDRDMRIVSDMTIYTTRMDNNKFDAHSLLNRLGETFRDYLISELGESVFHSLFPDPASTPSNSPNP